MACTTTVVRMKGADCGFGKVGKVCAWTALIAGVAFGLAATAAAAQQTVTPPDAATIERQWVAANRPYDEARKSILAQVQKTAWQGPMQPEWQSLTAYRTPEWYRDAKFGIFIRADAESDDGDLAGDRPIGVLQAATRWPSSGFAGTAGGCACLRLSHRPGCAWEGSENNRDDIASGWHGETSIKPLRSFVTSRKA
jgi:hypothetical protein